MPSGAERFHSGAEANHSGPKGSTGRDGRGGQGSARPTVKYACSTVLRPGEAGERRLPCGAPGERRLPCWRSNVHCRGAGWGAGFPVPRNGNRGIETVCHGLLRPPAGPGRRPGARPAAASQPAGPCARRVGAAGARCSTRRRPRGGTSAAEVITPTRRAARGCSLSSGSASSSPKPGLCDTFILSLRPEAAVRGGASELVDQGAGRALFRP